jgi:hypothetical protein
VEISFEKNVDHDEKMLLLNEHLLRIKGLSNTETLKKNRHPIDRGGSRATEPTPSLL